MLKSLLRGNLVYSTTFAKQIEDYKLPQKSWKRLKYSRQLKRLKNIPHDIIIDTGNGNIPIRLLVFMIHNDVPTTVLIDQNKNIQKIDLGPEIAPSIFRGTVLEVKYADGTFHVCDVLLFKGDLVTDRFVTMDKLNAEYLPFLSRPKIFTYSDIPQISDNKLMFLPKCGHSIQEAWVFVPIKCGK